jgi:GxxExxY protein
MIERFGKVGRIIGCAMRVHTALGPGLLESVHEKAIASELRKSGMNVEMQKPIRVFYESENVGDFLAGIVVDDEVIIENKAVSALAKAHEVQLVNNLTATKRDSGLLLNFGAERLEFKRKFRAPRTQVAGAKTDDMSASE